MAMRGKDIQEIAEVVYDIKDLKFHKEGMIDISEAERMIFESDWFIELCEWDWAHLLNEWMQD